MAVVHPLRSAANDAPAEERVNVVRLVEFLGPVSPELALVDPELAARARSLLPDLPGVRPPRRARDEPIPRRLAVPATSRRLAWRTATACAVAAVALASFGLGWSAALATLDEPRLASFPPVAAPASPTPSAAPVAPAPPPPTTATRKPAEPTPPTRPIPAQGAPRFVWPADPSAGGYRIALFRDGRRVFQRDVVKPALDLPPTWTFEGRLQSLRRGAYRWVVWPLFGPAKRQGSAIVSARYDV